MFGLNVKQVGSTSLGCICMHGLGRTRSRRSSPRARESGRLSAPHWATYPRGTSFCCAVILTLCCDPNNHFLGKAWARRSRISQLIPQILCRFCMILTCWRLILSVSVVTTHTFWMGMRRNSAPSWTMFWSGARAPLSERPSKSLLTSQWPAGVEVDGTCRLRCSSTSGVFSLRNPDLIACGRSGSVGFWESGSHTGAPIPRPTLLK